MASDDEAAFSAGFLRSLQEQARGKLFLSNLADDLASARISEADLRVFITALVDNFRKTKGGAVNDVDPLRIAAALLGGGTFLFRGPTFLGKVDKWCTVTNFNYDTCTRYFDLRKSGGVPAGRTPRALWAHIENLGPPEFFFRHTEALRGRVPMVWLAPAQDVDSQLRRLKDANSKASRLRDFLGLSHHSSDEFLVMWSIDATTASTPSRPLGFDAGPNLIFRTDRGGALFGRTVDLSTSGPGAREVVAKPIQLSSTIRGVAIGYVQNMSGCNFDKLYGKEFASRTSDCYSIIEDQIRRVL